MKQQNVDVYISSEKIKSRVKELGAQITKDYEGTEELVIIGVLNGSFMFCADLIREINLPINIEFISVSSYGDSTVSSGELKVNFGLKKDIKGKDVLLVEDIVDTGNTITKLISLFEKESPRTLKLASFLFKPARLVNEVKIDYLGIEIEDKFVIGYGLDFAGRYRELPYIGVYNENT